MSRHYLHWYCCFGINALSTPVLSFRHQGIVCTSADAEQFVFSWTLNSKYVIDVDIMINIIVFYIICSVYHDFAVKVKHIFKLYETIMETVSWLSWKYSYIALHFTFLFYCDIPHIHVKRVLVVQGHLVTPWPWLLIRGFKILFIEIFFSHAKPRNMITIYAFIPDILALEILYNFPFNFHVWSQAIMQRIWILKIPENLSTSDDLSSRNRYLGVPGRCPVSHRL